MDWRRGPPPTPSRELASPNEDCCEHPQRPHRAGHHRSRLGPRPLRFHLPGQRLAPMVEPEILLDGDHGIDRTLEVAHRVRSKVFYFLAENNVLFEGILLKPSMVTPGAESAVKASPEQVADYTLKMLKRRVTPAVPGIMFLSGGNLRWRPL